MPRKRPRTLPPASDLPSVFSVRAEEKIEANKIERDAWNVFLQWCSRVPEGTKVELLKHDRVIAWLNAAGTPSVLGLRVRV